MSVPIERIAEVAVVVSDLERSVRFYSEVLGMEVWDRQPDHVTVRCGKGFIGLWLPGAWKLPPSDNSEPLVLDGPHRQHFNFWIENKDGPAALENLQRHDVKFYGPRYNENGEIHIDFEDPDGHLLEYWGREKFETLPDRTPD
jgi:catechol 2,3-dioxygenase-like lactoylglutathione lyase family enzyme